MNNNNKDRDEDGKNYFLQSIQTYPLWFRHKESKSKKKDRENEEYRNIVCVK